MKKITLVLVILTFSSQAQTFPNPYCQITNGTIVEEITSVDFDTNSITNTDTTLNLIDATSTAVNVTPEETYTITVNGNTYEPFQLILSPLSTGIKIIF